jgi:hypothetical protein
MSQLREVDWLIDVDQHGDSYWRTCDFCDQCFMDDPPGQERKFYVDDSKQSLCVCEKCRAEYEATEVKS